MVETVEQPLQKLEHLSRPPIVEVVCGIKFKALAGFDPVVLGTYWQRRRGDFPTRQFREPLFDPNEFVLHSAIPVRVWLVSGDESTVLQFQHDRFFLNWRRTDGGEYPHFSGEGGVLDRTLVEFEEFSRFCLDDLGSSPSIVRCELSKVDQLIEGVHWNSLTDLGRMLPWLQPFLRTARSEQPTIDLKFREMRYGGDLFVNIDWLPVPTGSPRTVRLDTRAVQPASGVSALRSAFTSLNDTANGVFMELIALEERQFRFHKGEQ